MYASLMPDLVGVFADPMTHLDLAARHGFAGLDMRLEQVEDFVGACSPERMREAMVERGVRPGYCSFVRSPLVMAGDDEAWLADLEKLPTQAEAARTMGYERVGVVVLPFHANLSFDACFDLHVERLKQVVPVLSDHGLRLGLEYVSPITRRAGQGEVFIHDLKGMMELVDATNAEIQGGNLGGGVGLMLDTFHWACAGETLDDLRQLRGEQVVVLHVNDVLASRAMAEQTAFERMLPGANTTSSAIELAGFMGVMREIGYDGPVTCEPMVAGMKEMDDDEVVGMARRAMRGACGV